MTSGRHVGRLVLIERGGLRSKVPLLQALSLVGDKPQRCDKEQWIAERFL